MLSELLSRGYNAATPEIDVGEDIFVIEDGKENYWPVQVKTASAKKITPDVYSGQYKFKKSQLVTQPRIELTYVLALRVEKTWSSFLVIPRTDLNRKYKTGELGEQDDKWLTWEFIYENGRISCQGSDFSTYESNWEAIWPSLID